MDPKDGTDAMTRTEPRSGAHLSSEYAWDHIAARSCSSGNSVTQSNCTRPSAQISLSLLNQMSKNDLSRRNWQAPGHRGGGISAQYHCSQRLQMDHSRPCLAFTPLHRPVRLYQVECELCTVVSVENMTLQRHPNLMLTV
jgi:hypothetical protein